MVYFFLYLCYNSNSSESRKQDRVSERDEVAPELNKLIALSDMFCCKLDALVRENLYGKDGMTCMDVYIHVDRVSKTDAFTNFS